MKKITLDRIEETYKNHQAKAIGKHKYFSVLVPLTVKDGEVNMIFEVRSKKITRQPGEICFPGGEREPGESPLECALRETEEELNIKRDRIRVLSEGNTLYAYSGFTIHTFVGIIDWDDYIDCDYSRAEVSELFHAPVDFFAENPPEMYYNYVRGNFDTDFPYEKIGFPNGYISRGSDVEVPVYMYKGRAVWGITARIVKDFIGTVMPQSPDKRK